MSKRQWLTVTRTHDDGFIDRHTHSPEHAETYKGMIRRLNDAGRTFTFGPNWVEYESTHTAMGETWRSRSRLVWSDEPPEDIEEVSR